VLHPVYYRHICLDGVTKFARFATRVWGIPQDGKTQEALAKAGVEALADFIQEIGLPTTLRELGMTDDSILPNIANSCAIVAGSYRKLTHEEILEIFQECW
jgi:alcohol dehydrogenase YqhD (iron-dependent ADH family)